MKYFFNKWIFALLFVALIAAAKYSIISPKDAIALMFAMAGSVGIYLFTRPPEHWYRSLTMWRRLPLPIVAPEIKRRTCTLGGKLLFYSAMIGVASTIPSDGRYGIIGFTLVAGSLVFMVFYSIIIYKIDLIKKQPSDEEGETPENQLL